MSPAPYVPRLCARLRGYEIDFGKHRVTLWLESGHVADMSGSIRFAVRHDPRVRKIVTMSGDKMDTTFERRGNGWSARVPVPLAEMQKGKKWTS